MLLGDIRAALGDTTVRLAGSGLAEGQSITVLVKDFEVAHPIRTIFWFAQIKDVTIGSGMTIDLFGTIAISYIAIPS